MNGKGQIVTWRLTKDLTFNNIVGHLNALRDRLHKQGKQIREFYIDNCCAWRNLLQSVYGTALRVQLDVFHAVKRVSDKIPKRHPLRHECMKEFSMVFRHATDKGAERTKATPEPTVLVTQLNNFVMKWKNVEYNGWSVLSSTAIKETDNLRKHMERGCLSGIKPGRGTNKNEALHKQLNRIVSSSRYGIELAYALLSTIFFKHNEKICASLENRRERTVEEYELIFNNNPQVPSSIEHFGLEWSQSDKPQTRAKGLLSLPLLTLSDACYAEFALRITKHCTDAVATRACEDIEHIFEADDSSDEEDSNFVIPISALKIVLLKALSWYFVYEHLSQCSKTSKISYKSLPFMNYAVSIEA
jgi:hypothetical protein